MTEHMTDPPVRQPDDVADGRSVAADNTLAHLTPERVAAGASVLAVVVALAVILVGGWFGGSGARGPTDAAAASDQPSIAASVVPSPSPTPPPDAATLDLRTMAALDERLSTLSEQLGTAVAAKTPDIGVIATNLRSINAVVVSSAPTIRRLQTTGSSKTLGDDLATAYGAIGDTVTGTLTLALSDRAGYVAGGRAAIKAVDALASIDARMTQVLANPSAGSTPSPTPSG